MLGAVQALVKGFPSYVLSNIALVIDGFEHVTLTGKNQYLAQTSKPMLLNRSVAEHLCCVSFALVGRQIKLIIRFKFLNTTFICNNL